MTSLVSHLAQQSRLWGSLSCSSSHELHGEAKRLSFSVPQFPHRSNLLLEPSSELSELLGVNCSAQSFLSSGGYVYEHRQWPASEQQRGQATRTSRRTVPSSFHENAAFPVCYGTAGGIQNGINRRLGKIIITFKSCIYFHSFYLWQANRSPIYYRDAELPFYINVVKCK